MKNRSKYNTISAYKCQHIGGVFTSYLLWLPYCYMLAVFGVWAFARDELAAGIRQLIGV
ncbi:MAG: hypothetical protein R6U65_13600 [Perlabentimonas sp.]